MIPKYVFQTWYSKRLPPTIEAHRNRMIKENPDMQFFLYDDKDCEAFLQKHFPVRVIKAYRKLTPGAYKADLWRLCILFIYGGFYLDIKYVLTKEVRFKDLRSEPILTVERIKFSHSLKESREFLQQNQLVSTIMNSASNLSFWRESGKVGIYNAFLACPRRFPFLKVAIDKIVANVENNYYGDNPLAICGPSLLGKIYFERDYKKKLEQSKYYYASCGSYILTRERVIAYEVDDYRRHRKNCYWKLWKSKKVYNE
jgi:hypothetical protein